MNVTIQDALVEYNAKQEAERAAMYAGANISPVGPALNQVSPSAPDARYFREEMVRVVAQGVKFETPEEMIAAAEVLGVYVLLGPSPEQPKDTSNEDSTEAMVEGDDPFDGVTGQFPLGPAAEFKAAEFMGFTVTEKELPEGVLAEAVSANGEKVVITE